MSPEDYWEQRRLQDSDALERGQEVHRKLAERYRREQDFLNLDTAIRIHGADAVADHFMGLDEPEEP